MNQGCSALLDTQNLILHVIKYSISNSWIYAVLFLYIYAKDVPFNILMHFVAFQKEIKGIFWDIINLFIDISLLQLFKALHVNRVKMSNSHY